MNVSSVSVLLLLHKVEQTVSNMTRERLSLQTRVLALMTAG
jgi:hypothetical protein